MSDSEDVKRAKALARLTKVIAERHAFHGVTQLDRMQNF